MIFGHALKILCDDILTFLISTLPFLTDLFCFLGFCFWILLEPAGVFLLQAKAVVDSMTLFSSVDTVASTYRVSLSTLTRNLLNSLFKCQHCWAMFPSGWNALTVPLAHQHLWKRGSPGSTPRRFSGRRRSGSMPGQPEEGCQQDWQNY